MWPSVRSGLSRKSTASVSPESNVTPLGSATSFTELSPQLNHMLREISSDLSEMMDAEKASVRSQLAKKAREECMKDISHDLRTPLNAIIGFAQMMENGALGRIENPQYIEYLRHIRESGYELLSQVEELLYTGNNVEPPKSTSVRLRKNAAKLEEAIA